MKIFILFSLILLPLVVTAELPTCKEFGFTAGMLKSSIAEGRKKK
tara:strand:+ start:38 stop:172 length:135 start_codon:yes stop_codon:yes gene_type:complete